MSRLVRMAVSIHQIDRTGTVFKISTNSTDYKHCCQTKIYHGTSKIPNFLFNIYFSDFQPFIKENPKTHQHNETKKNPKILSQRSPKNLAYILLIFNDIYHRRSQPRLAKSIINNISKIHRIGNSIQNKIKPKQKLLISSFSIDSQRNKTKKNKNDIDIKYRRGIKCSAVVSQLKILRNTVYFQQIPIKKPK